MALTAKFYKHPLKFKFDAGTSRGVLREKNSYYVIIQDSENTSLFGLGEASPLKGLSVDDVPEFESILNAICNEFTTIDFEVFSWNINILIEQLVPNKFPSIKFAFETALLDILNGGKRQIFINDFSNQNKALTINGLVWMGDSTFMQKQVAEKINSGYTTIKLKIGAINFDEEIAIIKSIRDKFDASQITIRVDANGAFDATNVEEKLKTLAQFDIHSIEQPIKAGQPTLMAELCAKNILPIALDEELIGIHDYVQKLQLLKKIHPQYIILKPTLVGGIQSTKDWIEIANRTKTGWWITSALEANIGLNAICQLTAEYNNPLPQGLGTGQLFENNIQSPLTVENGTIFLHPHQNWDLDLLDL